MNIVSENMFRNYAKQHGLERLEINVPFLSQELLNSMLERVGVGSVWRHFACDQIRVFAS
jgi:hypothetical protein